MPSAMGMAPSTLSMRSRSRLISVALSPTPISWNSGRLAPVEPSGTRKAGSVAPMALSATPAISASE